MSGRLVLLGTGTCELDSHRSASAILVELPEIRFVHDFGRGVATRLADLGLRQDDLRHVILSHFHPDHFSDLIPYLHAALHAPRDPRTQALYVYGPEGLEEVMAGVLRLAGVADLGNEAAFRVELRPLSNEIVLGGRTVVSRPLPPAGNRGIRFEHGNRIVAFTGDSHFHADEMEFLRDVDLAVIDSGHLSDQEIVELAAGSRAELLVCSHLYRELDEDKLQNEAERRGFKGRLIVGQDLMEFAI